MTADPSGNPPGKRPVQWQRFLQFSLRSLLIATTLAAVGCWWFLRPEVRQEQLGQSSLRLWRETRQVEFDWSNPPLDETVEVWGGYGMGESSAIMNVGRWQLSDHGGNILVHGRYRNGKPHGKWTTYHVNGRKAAEGMMTAGKKVGTWRTWDEEGRVMEEVDFRRTASSD